VPLFSRILGGGTIVAASLFLAQTAASAAPAHTLAANTVTNGGLAYKHLAAQRLKPFFVSRATMTAVAARIRPKASPGDVAPDRSARTGHTALEYARLKMAALHAAATGAEALDVTSVLAAPAESNPPAFASDFEGLANSGVICPTFGPGGCQPPDQALAASKTAVLQGVNSSVAVYDAHSGIMRHGWPLDFNAFLGGAPAARVAKCDPNGPFLSDPRAFYDPNDQRFFVSIGQFDAPNFNGPKDKCANLSLIWIAVSVDANPDDGFYVVALDASEGGKSLADYPRLGFDDKTVEVSTNSFNYSNFAFTTSPMFYLSKYDLESGVATASSGIYVTYNGVPVDTMQPVETLARPSAQPGVIYNVFSFNINFGGGSCSSGCSNVGIVALSNPLSPRPGFAGQLVSTPLYLLPPNADDEFCSTPCIETLDTRISATPTYNATAKGGGAISWALETAQANATQIVPAFLWGIIDTAPAGGDPIGNFAAHTRRTGYVVARGDVANSFPATMLTDSGNRLSIVADVMGNFLYPAQVAYAIDAAGRHGPALLHAGIAPDLIDSRWGDYSATSFDGSNAWVSGQYSGGSGDWATSFAKLH